MPYGDGTGPSGKGGSGTGRGKGRGSGRGMGRGGGKDRGGLFGIGRKLDQFDFNMPQPMQPIDKPSQISKQQEIALLKQQTQILQKQLEELKEQISASKEKKKSIKPHIIHLKAVIDEQNCNYCGVCADVCEPGAIVIDDTVKVNKELCTGCGICVDECPKGAIAVIEGLYMIISIASGKGGTGKTTIAVNMALSLAECSSQTAKWIQLLDCDVEKPNAHIFIKHEFIQKDPVTVPVPQIDKTKCNYCGKCQEVCQYNAIAAFKKLVLVFRELCHGCGGCSLLCPEKALTESEKVIGFLEHGISKNLQFIHGRLNVGQTMSPPLIRVVKKQIEKSATVIIDAPPGTSCPVIEAIKGSTYCILVTEPTPFGMNDLILAVEVLRKLHIPFGVIINRAGLGNDEVEIYCSDNDIPLLMKIPFDRRIAECYSKGIPMVEALPEYKKKFVKLYEQISDGNLG